MGFSFAGIEWRKDTTIIALAILLTMGYCTHTITSQLATNNARTRVVLNEVADRITETNSKERAIADRMTEIEAAQRRIQVDEATNTLTLKVMLESVKRRRQ